MSITPEKIEDLRQTLSRARIFGPWNVNDEIAALLVALPALLTEISDLQSRLSSSTKREGEQEAVRDIRERGYGK